MVLALVGDVQWGDVGTWAGAVGSLAAVVAALYIALRPERLQRQRKPVLVIELGEVEPFERPVFHELAITEYRLRVAVKNEGRTTASHVSVTIERWWSYAGHPRPWTENPIDPIPAEWVGQDAYTGQDALSVDIPPGGRAFCEVLRWRPNDQVLELAVDTRRKLSFPIRGGPLGEQRISLHVSCHNAEGRRFTVSGTITSGVVEADATNIARQSPIHDVKLAEEPEPQDVLHNGLLGLWREPEG